MTFVKLGAGPVYGVSLCTFPSQPATSFKRNRRKSNRRKKTKLVFPLPWNIHKLSNKLLPTRCVAWNLHNPWSYPTPNHFEACHSIHDLTQTMTGLKKSHVCLNTSMALFESLIGSGHSTMGMFRENRWVWFNWCNWLNIELATTPLLVFPLGLNVFRLICFILML